MAVREKVGLFDMTSFGKIRVEGRDALSFLQRLCANDMDVEPGRIVYTQMLNTRGGIECDLTVTRLSETAFLLVVPGATLQRDLSLAQAASRRRVRGDHRCDGGGGGALRDGAERAVADAGRQPE
jgi:glycine cleavage system aminomethyltransferase T